jgi:hypothetical protein
MKSPLVVLGLALSALFNVFFLAGYVQARRTAADVARARDVTERVRGELGLDPAQSALFDDLRRKWREDAEVYGENLALLRQDMVEELDREPRDPARLGDVLDREAELRRQWRFAEAGRFGDFLGALTPEQRRKLMGRLGHGGPRHGGRLMKQFDANRNGVLDPDERALAREHTRSRFADRPRHWPQPAGDAAGEGRPEGFEHRGGPGPGRLRGELMRRFDADHDGKLAPQEESALLEWIRQGPVPEAEAGPREP